MFDIYFFIGIIMGLFIGSVCSFFKLPVPAPQKLIGSLLVLAMTIGYNFANYYIWGYLLSKASKSLSDPSSLSFLQWNVKSI